MEKIKQNVHGKKKEALEKEEEQERIKQICRRADIMCILTHL